VAVGEIQQVIQQIILCLRGFTLSIFIAAIYHCLSFANAPAYGTQQEGIVIKNQTAGERSAYIKICKSGVQGNAEEES
jgi:Na+/H+ antiporter NhaA